MTENKCRYEDKERYLCEMLALIREQHVKAAKPYVDRLAQIHAMRMPEPIIIAIERALELGRVPPNAELSKQNPDA